MIQYGTQKKSETQIIYEYCQVLRFLRKVLFEDFFPIMYTWPGVGPYKRKRFKS